MLAKLEISIKENKQNIIYALIIIGVLIGAYLIFFKWYLPKYITLSKELVSLEAEVHQLNLSFDQLEALKQDFSQKKDGLEKQLAGFNWHVTRGEPILTLGNSQVDELLQFVSIFQGQPELEKGLWKAPYTVEAKGPFSSILEYLIHLDSARNTLIVDRLNIDYIHSLDYLPKDEIRIIVDLIAYGLVAYSGPGVDLSTILAGRENIFLPTLGLPKPQAEKPGSSPDDPPPVLRPEAPKVLTPEYRYDPGIPRYDFPKEGEF